MSDLVEEFVVEHRGQKATVRIEQEGDLLWHMSIVIRPDVRAEPSRKIPVGYLEVRSNGFQDLAIVKAASIEEAKAQIDRILDRE